MVFKAVVTCPEPQYGYLLTAGQQVVWVRTVEAWVLMLPLGLLLGLYDGFCFRVAGGPVDLSDPALHLPLPRSQQSRCPAHHSGKESIAV